MWGQGHHRKGRLSLPSIRISTAPDLDGYTDSNSAPLDRGLASSHPAGLSGGSRPISHDYQQGTTSSLVHHPPRQSAASQGASVSSSSAHNSVTSRRESGQPTTATLLPPPTSELSIPEREIEHSILFRSLRGDYKPYDDEEQPPLELQTSVNDPFMPPELIAAIQTSMKKCSEYERQCAQLEHSIEHKILMFLHILEQYEGQDHTATELREMISGTISKLQGTTPTMQSAETTAITVHEKLDGYQKTLNKAKEIAKKSKETMSALEEHMTDQEIIHDKIETWQNALLGFAAALVVLLGILLAWLFS